VRGRVGEGGELARDLARVERAKKLKAIALVAPLFVFLCISFIGPIGALLSKSFVDTEVAPILPRVCAEIMRWNGRDLPDEATFSALIEDIRSASAAGTLARAATRLNYDISGYRTLLFSTARGLAGARAGSARDTLRSIDKKWGEAETWGAIARAAGPTTSLFVLAAVDLRRNAAGEIIGALNEEAIFVHVMCRTFTIAAGVTFVCLLLGYPLAYALANAPARVANILLVFVLLPFWTSLLVRTSAWIVLLQREGVVNKALMQAGLLDAPLQLLFNRFAVVVAMTHVLLPFMVLPLFAVMKTIPAVHTRAALSLGATPGTAFLRVYAPQTLPGVGAGVLMVFIQALGYYITPALVGGANDQMLSYFVSFYAAKTINWGMAAALSLVLLVATLFLYYLYDRLVGIDRVRMG